MIHTDLHIFNFDNESTLLIYTSETIFMCMEGEGVKIDKKCYIVSWELSCQLLSSWIVVKLHDITQKSNTCKNNSFGN